MKFYLLFVCIILSQSFRYKNSKSLFESIDSNENPQNKHSINDNNIYDNTQESQMDSNSDKALSNLLDKLKKEIKTPYLKDNLTPESIANYFATTLSGNQVINNLEVYDQTHLNNVEVKENLTVHGDSFFDSITTNKFISNPIIIDENDIIINKDTSIKIGNNSNNNFTYTIKDIFEAITFVKYIVTICGEKLNKCDFKKLMIDRGNNDEIKQNDLISTENSLQFKELDPSIHKNNNHKHMKYNKQEQDIKSSIEKEYEIYKNELMSQQQKVNKRNNNNKRQNYKYTNSSYINDKIPNLDIYYNDIVNRYYFNQGGVYNIK